jgi:hypothetical protein
MKQIAGEFDGRSIKKKAEEPKSRWRWRQWK